MAARFGLSSAQAGQLEALLDALASEPDPHTTAADPAVALEAHVADALVAVELPAIRAASSIADIGTGQGFPGLALAVARPDASVALVDSATRKVELAVRLAEAGNLANVRGIHARAEDHAREARERYDVVTARAVGPLPVVLEYAAPLLADGGSVVVWRGRRDPAEEERAAAAAAHLGLGPGEVWPVTPFPAARDRHLHAYRKTRPTPDRFPRRAGMARKRPLG